MCNQYNGWSNYPTWNVQLWIDNDEYLSDFIYGTAKEFYDADKESFNRNFSNWLQEYIETEMDESVSEIINGSSMFSDIFGWALEIVDWHELARTWKDKVIENEGYEEETDED